MATAARKPPGARTPAWIFAGIDGDIIGGFNFFVEKGKRPLLPKSLRRCLEFPGTGN